MTTPKIIDECEVLGVSVTLVETSDGSLEVFTSCGWLWSGRPSADNFDWVPGAGLRNNIDCSHTPEAVLQADPSEEPSDVFQAISELIALDKKGVLQERLAEAAKSKQFDDDGLSVLDTDVSEVLPPLGCVEGMDIFE